jgi:hypothetical protein
MSAWREALRLMRLGIVARIWIGALLLIACAILWLQIPDSHIWQFLLSVVFVCAWIGCFLWFSTDNFKRLFGKMERSHWISFLSVAGAILIGWLIQIPIDRLAAHREIFAGYWASQLPHWLRGARTYEHLIAFQDWGCLSLRLIVIGLLLPAAVIWGSRTEDSKKITGVWTKWWYWAAVLLCGWLASLLNTRLLNWTPGHGLMTEATSLLTRLSLVYTIDVLLLSFVLSNVVIGAQKAARS